MARVLVLHALLPPGGTPASLAALLQRLPYAKRAELERRTEADRLASLAGVWLALEGATRLLAYPPEPAQLRFPAGGRPSLAGGPSFSISHASRRVGVALAHDDVVGFDLEETRDAVQGQRAAERLDYLGRWTAIEATLKAAGRGLREARAVEIDAALEASRLDGTGFRLARVAIAPGVIAHLATPRVPRVIQVEECRLPDD